MQQRVTLSAGKRQPLCSSEVGMLAAHPGLASAHIPTSVDVDKASGPDGVRAGGACGARTD